jgi:hypothetical protein
VVERAREVESAPLIIGAAGAPASVTGCAGISAAALALALAER